MSLSALEQAQSEEWRDAALSEILSRISEHDVKHVYLQYTSVPGRVMGKVVPARHFERFAESGVAWTYISAAGFAANLQGEVLGPSGAVAAEGLLVPDLRTFQILPWDTDFARVVCDHFHPPDHREAPGASVPSDVRGNLKRVHAEFQRDLGLQLKTGCEPEMSWFPSEDEITSSISNLPDHISTAYHIDHLEGMRPILKRVTAYGQAMGLDMIQADYEDPGQVEMNFAFGDCLATADRLTTYRQICMQVAKELDVFATFMPKPVASIMANGCHHHVSLWRDQEAAFELSREGQINELGRWAIGGVLSHARGMSAICASTVNSYARYWDVGLFAPTIPIWGYDNRTCVVRVLGPRFEFRAPDAACNPYLTHAVLLAAMRDGISNRIDPGAPIEGEPDASFESDGRFGLVPGTFGEALEALEADEVIRSALPDDLYDTFMAVKRDEWHRSCGAITDWQRDVYLKYLP